MKVKAINLSAHCDICKGPFEDYLFDAATRQGPWATMCSQCYVVYGRGLGTGRGQKFERTPEGWVKVEG